MSERCVFTDECKRDAVRLAKERGNTSDVTRDIGIHESVLSRWKKRLEADPQRPFPGKGNLQDLELAQMKHENARLKQENEILNAAVGIFQPSRLCSQFCCHAVGRNFPVEERIMSY